MKNFALVGASGFIAPKHFNAIKKTNNNLSLVYDKNDTVGKIDAYFDNSHFILKIENFKKYLKLNKKKLDYLVICLPNYLHFEFIKIGLQNNLNIICEKPLVLNSKQLNELKNLEKKFRKKVNCIMQLRLDKSLISQINKFKKKNNFLNIDVKYVTTRGDWFLKSWKGDTRKSGGLTTNIGIHLFDFLIYNFGEVIDSQLLVNKSKTSKGVLFFKKAKVNWLISVDKNYLPKKSKSQSYRMIKIKNNFINLSNRFTDLHTKSYMNILSNKGFGVEDVRKSLELCEKLRNEKK